MYEFWDRTTNSSNRSVDIVVTKIRAKLKDCDDFKIATVQGLGYRAVIKENWDK